MMNTAEPASVSPSTAQRPDEPPRRAPGPLPLLYPERAPIISLCVAAMVSFMTLAISPSFVLSILMKLDSGSWSGPLLLPWFGLNVVLAALLGTAILSVITLVVWMFLRGRPRRPMKPYLLAFPVAWVLVVPSSLELGGSPLAWIAFGSMLAMAFCFHWWVFSWAIDTWE
jgi:hypothetical protein